ncbi:hypothetical protein SU67_24610, partial [Escherichia coli O139:H28 str. E24377A]
VIIEIIVPPAPPPAPKNVSLLDVALQPPPPPPPPVIVTLIRFVPGVGVYVPDEVKTRVFSQRPTYPLASLRPRY